ncbi:MAG: GH3 auxin-responsive promoter family protein [Bacteroides sp.]|nr:GH3 auxin-responsive promoter family protein [Bacteroides sp.]MCM1379120.1 GH3 auxin-responsive promoter family protein [Bacteroides sp.]MCM1446489.1 GH3 auxin-responsive promoter family protein [Prevotella sp.]
MLNFTPLCRPIFAVKAKTLKHHAADLEATQTAVLRQLLRDARSTEIGRRYGFSEISDAAHYCSRVPLRPYEEIRQEVMRMVRGEANVLWPGKCRRYAQSSGTSDGRSKYVPVTDSCLARNHYAGSADCVALYLSLYPESQLMGGRSFILGGSFATEADHPADVKIGDLSAHLIEKMPSGSSYLRIPADKRVALLTDWHEKLPALVEASRRADIRSISGVPSWFLTVLREVLKATGAESIHDVWPNLEVFFHGGISFDPYREQYDAITDTSKMHYLETYNASEGFFAVQDRRAPGAMLLIPDAGVFYEFDPMDGSEPRKAWEVDAGKVYSIIITSSNGLWRYPLGDTVRIETTNPLRISIAGRTKLYINAFGEELMVHNSDAAVAATCAALGCEVSDYTAAPLYTTKGHHGRHQWLIEFDTPPASVKDFAAELDRRLCRENSDYAAKRSGSIFLDPPEVIELPRGTFNRWLESTGKLGGQRKVPRLCPDRHIVDSILSN